MNDWSDGENSPRHQVPENQFLLQVQQAYQAHDIGASRVRRAVAIQPNASNEDLEGEDEEELYERYAHSNLSDVSQPDLWMEIHHQDESKERYMRYLFAERDEVSDGEYWDELFNKPCARMKRLQTELQMKLWMSWKEKEVMLGES